MAPLRSPSNSRLDDLLSDDDHRVDPLSDHDSLAVDWREDHSPSAGLDRLLGRFPWLPASGPRLGAALVGVIALGLVGWWFLRPAPAPVETSLPMASSTGSAGGGAAGAAVSSSAAAATTTTAGPVVVQAAGAVARPGVYRLDAAARVDDLVRAAGGLRADADGDRVNLAAPLADGARVWIPAQGETEAPDLVAGADGGSGGTGSSGGSGGGTAGSTPEVVDLNTADAQQLDALPGVGPTTASAILAYRDEHGPFSSVDDLLEVRGIGDAKLEQIRPLARA